MTPIIGGKSDGKTCPCKLPKMEQDGEIYMLIGFKDGEKQHVFYQLAGMVPAEAQATYRARHVKP